MFIWLYQNAWRVIIIIISFHVKLIKVVTFTLQVMWNRDSFLRGKELKII